MLGVHRKCRNTQQSQITRTNALGELDQLGCPNALHQGAPSESWMMRILKPMAFQCPRVLVALGSTSAIAASIVSSYAS